MDGGGLVKGREKAVCRFIRLWKDCEHGVQPWVKEVQDFMGKAVAPPFRMHWFVEVLRHLVARTSCLLDVIAGSKGPAISDWHEVIVGSLSIREALNARRRGCRR